MLRVHEIFRSIQGESTYAGLPCVFVRLSGCNLSCSYCDTPGARSGGEEMDVAEILDEVRSLGGRLVEVTGGEPLLQEETPSLVRRLLDEGYHVLVETNGSVPLEGLDRRAVVVLDVKCPSSGFAGSTRWENIDLLGEKDEVKFVIGTRVDYEWAKASIAGRFLPSRVKVLMSPSHGTLDPAVLAAWILADRLDVRLQIQMHRYVGMR
jgi:7-carboxy-7-deazaguanine synthase